MKTIWWWLQDNGWGWVLALWYGGLTGGVVFGVGFTPIGISFIAAGICWAFTEYSERRQATYLTPNFPHRFCLLIALITCGVLADSTHTEIKKQVSRYNEIMADWRAGQKDAAIEQLNTYLWLEKHKP